jgi:hypothetical protein
MATKRRFKKSYRKTRGRKHKRSVKRGGNGKPCNLSYNYITNAANRPNHGY